MEKAITTRLREILGKDWKLVEDCYLSCPRYLIDVYRRIPKKWFFLKWMGWKHVAVLCLGDECVCFDRDLAETIESAMKQVGYSTVLKV